MTEQEFLNCNLKEGDRILCECNSTEFIAKFYHYFKGKGIRLNGVPEHIEGSIYNNHHGIVDFKFSDIKIIKKL